MCLSSARWQVPFRQCNLPSSGIKTLMMYLKPNKLLLISFICLASAIGSLAQDKADESVIYGRVLEARDSGDDFPLARATVKLVSGSDSLWTATDLEGYYTFRITPAEEVVITISSMGYKTFSQKYDFARGKNLVVNYLEPSTELLNMAVVSAQADLIRRVADTTIVNAAALRYLKGDKAIDLFSQVPGAEVSGGKIMFDGEEVVRTYINGLLVFGDNASTAMTKLDAEEVVSFNIYDEQSALDKERGLILSDKERVINVTTRSMIFQSINIDALASIGMDQAEQASGAHQTRYSGGVTGSFYSEQLVLDVNANSNNNGNSSSTAKSIQSGGGALGAYKESSALSAEVTKYWKDRNFGNNLTLMYRYAKDYQKDSNRTLTEWLETSANPAMLAEESLSDSNSSGKHVVMADLKLNRTFLKSLELYNYTTVSSSGMSSSLLQSNQYQDGHQTGQNEKSGSTGRGWNQLNTLKWSNPSMSSGWFPQLSLSSEIGHTDQTRFSLDTLESSFHRRQLTSDAAGISRRLNGALYMEKTFINTAKDNLSFSAGIQAYLFDETKKQTTLDMFGSDTPVVDIANTYDFTQSGYSHSYGAKLAYRQASGFSLTASATLDFKTLVDKERFPDALNQPEHYWSLCPSLIVMSSKYRFSYTVTPQTPSVQQTRMRIDDSNPLFLRAGNPDLMLTKIHHFDIYRIFPASKKGASGTISLSANYHQNPIVTKSRYYQTDTPVQLWSDYTIPSGATLVTYENAPYSLSLNVLARGSKRIKKLSGTLSGDMGYTFSTTPQYEGEMLNNVRQNSASLDLKLTTTPMDGLKLNLSSKTSFIDCTNDQGRNLTRSLRESVSGSLKANALGPRSLLDVTYTGSMYHFLKGNAKDIGAHILSAALGYYFFDFKLFVSVSANDLLNSGSVYTIKHESNKIVQSWSPTYGRYFLFNISWNFSKNG